MDNMRFDREQTECPDRNARCTKLAAKTIEYFARGGDYVQLDPRFGGLAWNFVSDVHYDHIADAVTIAARVPVERVDTLRRPGTEETPTYGLKRASQED